MTINQQGDALNHYDAPEHGPANELSLANLEIQRTQRQIGRGMAELAEGIVGLSLILREVRKRQLYRFDPEYPTFEQFVERRHGISADQALVYVEALESLGESHFRTLLTDCGLQRTYALAMLKRTDPTLVTAFQALPFEERTAITVAQIEQLDVHVTTELQARLNQLEQEITREQGLLQQTKRRLQEAEELHQRVATSLIEDRDAAQHALDQEQEQTERLRKLLAEAQRSGSAKPAKESSLPIPQPIAGSPTSIEAIVTIVACDPKGLAIDIRSITQKLEQFVALPPQDISNDDRSLVMAALQSLIETIEHVEDHYAFS